MEHKFTMSLSLNVLNHLGINLYSNVPAVLSEIVANSWDADAENVTIAISSDEIIIEDNGCGMTVSDINSHFLKVGYQKREDETASSKFKRRFMGRKGIGKLSMFSIAREVDVISRKTVGGVIESNALRMNIDKIADSIKNENINAERDYHPDVITEGYTPLEKDGIPNVQKFKQFGNSVTIPVIEEYAIFIQKCCDMMYSSFSEIEKRIFSMYGNEFLLCSQINKEMSCHLRTETLNRYFDIVYHYKSNRFRVKELASYLNMSAARASQIISQLVQVGCVHHEEDGTYQFEDLLSFSK